MGPKSQRDQMIQLIPHFRPDQKPQMIRLHLGYPHFPRDLMSQTDPMVPRSH